MYKALDALIGRVGKDGLLILGILSVIGALAAGIIVEMMLVAFANEDSRDDYLDKYGINLKKANCVKILDEYPDILAKPTNGKGSAKNDSDLSFGITKETNFTIEVSGVYTMDNNIDINSRYCGLKVSEILDTPEGKLWFPKEIENDSDDIVWISERYLRIT